MVDIYKIKYYLAVNGAEVILSLEIPWMNLKDIMLNTERQIHAQTSIKLMLKHIVKL